MSAHSDVLVVFGASGDLARKMTFPSLYRLARRKLLKVPIIGVSFSDWTDADLKAYAKKAIREAGLRVDAKVFARMTRGMKFVKGDYTKLDTFERVKASVGKAKRPLFYLEIPPALFQTVVYNLSKVGLTENGRVIIEKPFGHDLASAQALNVSLLKVLREEQLYRIDHYLGKEPVQDLLVWRFGNTMFEPVWNRRYISNVQITMSETVDVADRGSFYDAVGALKDVVQNHMMQVVALLAMEPPVSAAAQCLHDEQIKVFNSMRPIDPVNYVRGQYDGFTKVDGVAKKSRTESYCALRIDIDSWRWEGVPFFLRTGKALAAKATEAVVEFRNPPKQLFDDAGCAAPETNRLRFRLGSDAGVSIEVQAKKPGEGMHSEPIALNVDFAQALGDSPLPYERLLGDALAGESTLFASERAVEGTWAAIDPILGDVGPIRKYARGSMGPKEANRLTAEYGGWVDPIGVKAK
ncbi:MAG: glucose-6-phosphate dehydrogenase [Candidatus Binatia bacterium]|nr:glucose-6-phosphate dehydrogenase [Candidatus Binatia bacterium]